MHNIKQHYYLKENLQNHQIYRLAKGVDKQAEKGNWMATYEDAFDIIDETHLKLAYVRYYMTMNNHMNIWFGLELQIRL
jgi:hypothetical protein